MFDVLCGEFVITYCRGQYIRHFSKTSCWPPTRIVGISSAAQPLPNPWVLDAKDIRVESHILFLIFPGIIGATSLEAVTGELETNEMHGEMTPEAAPISSGYNMMTKKGLTGIILVLTKCGLYKI